MEPDFWEFWSAFNIGNLTIGLLATTLMLAVGWVGNYGLRFTKAQNQSYKVAVAESAGLANRDEHYRRLMSLRHQRNMGIAILLSILTTFEAMMLLSLVQSGALEKVAGKVFVGVLVAVTLFWLWRVFKHATASRYYFDVLETAYLLTFNEHTRGHLPEPRE